MSFKENFSKKFKLNHGVFWPPFIGLIILVIVGLTNEQVLSNFVPKFVSSALDSFGWAFGQVTILMMIVMAIILFHPISKTRIGGKNAKSEFSFKSWFAMALCSSIAIGIVFWGVAEPIYHFANPPAPLGIEPFSDDAILNSLSTIWVHWGFSQYCYYTIFAILIGLACFNYQQPFMVSSSLYFLNNNKPVNEKLGKVIDAFCVLGIVGGVTSSLGMGILQLTSGANFLWGITPSRMVWFVVAATIVITFTISSYTGLQKGIRLLSDQNVKLYYIILVVMFFIGPTLFILNVGSEGLAHYLGNFFQKTLFTGGPSRDAWAKSWTMFYYPSTASFAPLVGMFMARISYGRTVRETLLGYWVAPAIFNLIWFNVFGGTAMHMQKTGIFDIWGVLQEKGLESSIFEFFGQFPIGTIITYTFLVTIFISFVTLADSMTSCISIMSTDTAFNLYKSREEAPAIIKLAWGSIMGCTAYIFIAFGGINGAKSASQMTGFPIYLLVIGAVFSLWKAFFSSKNREILESEESKIISAS